MLSVVCPCCFRPIQVRAGRIALDDDGDLAVDVSPAMVALNIHVRVGCSRNPG